MISVIIPTLQRNIDVFYKLLDNLCKDSEVGEILVIDNSTKGIEYQNEKIRVLIPTENVYVNPAWNWGVKEAKYEIIALLNDDIILPDDFCKLIANKMSPEMGVVGLCQYDVKPVESIDNQPEINDFVLEKATYMDCCYGVAMFFYKDAYVEIPDEIKINYGDAWIFKMAHKNKRTNYRIKGQTVYHLGSISSRQKCFNPIHKNDARLYNKLTVKWYHRLFSLEEHYDCLRMRILGITIKIKNGVKVKELWDD